MSKAGITYGYRPGLTENGGLYAVRNTSDEGSYSYDANGNMLNNGLGRALTWNADNQPSQIVSGSTTEQYYYDADGSRVKRTSGGVTTYFIGGLYEEDGPSGTIRVLYQFNGQTVAQREIAPVTPTNTPTSTSTSTPTNTRTNTPTNTPTSTRIIIPTDPVVCN